MSLFFSMKETILFPLFLLLVFIPAFPLAIPFALIMSLGRVLCSSFRHLLPLLSTALLLYVEHLLVLALLLLLLTLISVVSLCISVASLLLLVLVLLI
jgi:hypothetical protein